MSDESEKILQRGFEYGVKHILSPRSGALSAILPSTLDISEAEIKNLLSLGAVYVEGTRTLEDIGVAEQTYIRVHTKPRRFPSRDIDWNTRILFKHDDFILINKPAGLPCHASVDNIQENLLAYLHQVTQENFLITHRLDVPTQGLLILARNKEFQKDFNQMLKDRSVRKIYRAVCTKNSPRLGTYVHYMIDSPRAPKTLSLSAEDGQRCELEVLSCKASELGFEVDIELLTGRTHQIRAQMSFSGSPLRGDVLYGAEKIYEIDQIDLLAHELRFKHPRSQEEFHFKIS